MEPAQAQPNVIKVKTIIVWYDKIFGLTKNQCTICR
jgi:hypothetical protein